MLVNNDIIRRVRYALDIKDNVMIKIFKEGGYEVTREDVLNILKKSEDEGFLKCNNQMLEAFLDGLIVVKRGRKEEAPGTTHEPVKMTKNNINNIIMRKLRIALSFRSEDMLHVLKLAGVEISPSELSAIFRKEDHKNYRECGDRYLRNFLKGLVIYYRG
ncbi:hypothetical protein IX317_001406 [Fusobacterium sp. DD29]|uniref:DUF1456 family protein n=1 Tax=unclassified Fusobacterium TaxID=2648384 RepID=UPI001B8D1D5E|nr:MULTISPECIES: DUF1456 family protein [unclassified Fusobacterium]MBR8701986.1 hypothetical protein [Fusobacterium sp. DD45]MBR8711787.1 hypothetical protein [Fusobacterium sp. DD28]MBR8749728.1 hypothetical protein [Fusobacterium sp. DD29]MBR8752349.1 hypothetical protein [Fusobacterium sp. DD26]MBR8768007.1 hypothetical protein [Fusobacterium sp. DD43]